MNTLYYHGSDKKFSSFSKTFSKRGKAIFFTKNKIDATSYGKYLYTVSIDRTAKIFNFRDPTELAKLTDCIQDWLSKEKIKKGYKARNYYPYTTSKAFQLIGEGSYGLLGHPITLFCLIKLKYDGWLEMENRHQEQVGIVNLLKIHILTVEEID